MTSRMKLKMPIRVMLIIIGFAALLALYFINADGWYPVRFTALGIDVSRYAYASGLIILSIFAGLIFQSGMAGKWRSVTG